MNIKAVLLLFIFFHCNSQPEPVFEYTPFEDLQNQDSFIDVTETTSGTKGDCDLSTQIGAAPSAINTQPFLSATPPFRITLPGQYCLTINVSVPAGSNGIVIDSNNVSINLNGKCIQGQTGSLHGISVTGNNRSNISIRNGFIANMGLNAIQFVSSGEQILLENLKFCRNSIGFNLAGLRDFVIRDCLITFHRNQGMFLNIFGTTPMQNGIISNCLTAFNSSHGVQITQGNNLVFSNIVSFNNTNPGSGFLETNGNRITFESCQANNNAVNGFLSSGISNSFAQCIANNNNGVGFLVRGNRLTMNDMQAKGNTTDGFRLTGNNCTISNATSQNNTNIGFNISGNQHSYENCNAESNSIGFAINNANHCILNNQAKANANFGFFLQPGSTQCQVRSNTAVANNVGFQNNTTTVNRIYSNFSSDNTTAQFVGVPNVFTSPVPADAINFTTNIAN